MARYIVSKDYDRVTHEEFYYCHMKGYNYVPVFGSIGNKKKAESICKLMNQRFSKKGE